MSFSRLILAGALAAGALTAAAEEPTVASLQWLTEAEHAELVLQRQNAVAPLPKEISQGCNQPPLSTSPTGPTFTGSYNDTMTGTAFDIVAWRKTCSDSDSQLMITLVPKRSTLMAVSSLFAIEYNGRKFNAAMLTDEAGTVWNGQLSRTTTILLRPSFGSATWDDEAALTVKYLGLFGDPVALALPAVNAVVTPPSFVIDSRVRGSYFNRSIQSQGLLLDFEPSANLLAGAWFTAHPTTGAIYWYTFSGVAQGDSAAVDLYEVRNINFAAPSPNEVTTKIGTATIQFTDCTHARFTVTSGLTVAPMELERLTTAPAECAQ